MSTLFDILVLDDIQVDRRATQRDKRIPNKTDIRWVESYGEALQHANSFVPCAIIRENGKCVLFSCGGSGLVWVCTADGQMSDAQGVMVDRIVNGLVWLGAMESRVEPLPYYDL
jgi:hypothetical protein